MTKSEDDLADIEAVRAFDSRLAAGMEELIPAEFVNRMIDGENKIKVWREYRGLSARDLAEKAGISVDKLDRIENGELNGDKIGRIAAALGLADDELN